MEAVVVQGLILFAIIVVGYCLVLRARKALIEGLERQFGDDLTMEQVHELHAEGTITDGEYRQLKREVSRRSREFLDEKLTGPKDGDAAEAD